MCGLLVSMRRRRPLQLLGLTLLLLVGGSLPAIQAQDRGAPRFGPAVPGDTASERGTRTGRLWGVTAPPLNRFERLYDVDADSTWTAQFRRSLLRLPDCSGALVSNRGLALTTARCVRKHLKEPLEGAFVAEKSAEERRLSALEVRRLVSAQDVTAAVHSAQPDTAPQLGIRSVENRLQSEAGENGSVEVTSIAGGSQYTAYTYRTYEDVRLVFLPSPELSGFGGIEAALTYPRHQLDVALLRLYNENGTPLTPERYFRAPTQARRPGDPVFAAGFPKKTRRVESVEQLAYVRDVVLPAQAALLQTWHRAVTGHLDTASTSSDRWSSALDEGRRALKRNRARTTALETEYVWTQLQKRDEELRHFLESDGTAGSTAKGILDSLADIQSAKRELAPAYRAFGPPEMRSYQSSTYRRALLAHQAAGAEGRERTKFLRHLSEVPSQPRAIDAALLEARLSALREYLQPDPSELPVFLNGHSPEERATEIVATSQLAGSAFPEGQTGEEMLPSPDDSALQLVRALADPYQNFRNEIAALHRAEKTLTHQLAQARFRARNTSALPAAQGAPRLTDGRLRGYPYNGTYAPPFTTVHGLFGQAQSFKEDSRWTLPERWTGSLGLDRSTPLNVSAAIDGVAAPPGAPIFNQYLEIVGVTIGTNIQGAAGTYIYLPRRMRAVAVDLRGLRQALSVVYEASPLVQELFPDSSVPAEESP